MIEDVFDNLVGQFSDPFTFYRELIQNAMDAGSEQIEVTVNYLPEFQMVEVLVADSGEGMDLEIINSRLTQLFSSTKEDDFTKIGKFGIGFVSVFAMKPALVMVDTGKSGEFWRVAFDGTTAFEILELQQPVEGTTVKVYKPLVEQDFQEFCRRSLATIRFWCRYSETEVTFNGEVINEKLQVQSPCQIFVERPGTEMVLGVTSSTVPEYGLYNQGLTLKEGKQDDYAGVTYKIKSRYLEHTLTRDNILEDEHYTKVMAMLKEAAENELPRELCERLAELAKSYPEGASDYRQLMAASLPLFSRWREGFPDDLKAVGIFPVLHGPPRSLEQVVEAAKKEESLYSDLRPTRVSRTLAEQGIPVFCHSGGALEACLAAVSGVPVRRASHNLATPIALKASPELELLSSHLIGLLRRGRSAVNRVCLADFDYDGSCVTDRACLAQVSADEPIRLFERGFWKTVLRYPRILLYNRNHHLVRKCLSQARRSPRLAAFVLAKAALLQDGLPQKLEAKLVGRALKV